MSKGYLVISGDGCPSCKTLKAKLESKGIKYTEKDVWSDDEALTLMTQNGLRSIPQLFLDGELVDKESI